MILGELPRNEKFKYKNETWTKLRKVNTHSKYDHDIYDCMNSEGRHRPFRDDVEVEPCQTRLDFKEV